ncbi:MAG: hypothetical protein JXM79_13960 [Sedimentisphaerales bacterium]|nr:hypothetical protein [Sedimentisphaerales bacterium]
MRPRLNFIFYLAIGTLFVAFWIPYVPGTVCYGADQDANDAAIGKSTEPSSDEPNSVVEIKTQTDQNDVSTEPAPEAGSGSRRTPFWATPKMIAFYVIVGIAIIAVVGWFLLKSTGRTRLGMRQTLSQDEDLAGGEFLIVFNWTQKVLYLPTVIASFIAALFMYFLDYDPALPLSSEVVRIIEIVGGVWFAIFFFNFLIEEYNIRLMVIVLSLVSIGFLLLLLILFECMGSFFRLFKHLDVFISWKGFLLAGFIGLLTIVVSWIKGLFYYVVVTPNYLNLQEGLTETGKQIARRDFHTSVDTTDLAERLFGFGKIIVTFKQSEKEPITLYVWRIGAKAKKLEEMGTKTIVT